MSITIAGLAAMILTQVLGDTVSAEQIGNFIHVAGLIGSSLFIWYGRWRMGDVTWYGRKI